MDFLFLFHLSNMQLYLNIIMLIYNIICILLITLVIAALTLIERKVLSLVQRRVGPQFVGYRGRLQYIADALKLFIKGVIVPDGSNKF
jgi:NADH-quinone oxidoreductase subunit H